jgi:hypothetical protein
MSALDTSCESRIDSELKERLTDLRRLWTDHCAGKESEDGTFSDYGLCFDYVPPDTFADQREGYFRYQLSWGGPSDEFRFFINPDLSCHRIEYWFLDWFDGASRILSDDDDDLLLEIWHWFNEIGLAPAALRQSDP